MSDSNKFAETMRIDIAPQSAEAAPQGPPATRKRKRAGSGPSAGHRQSSQDSDFQELFQSVYDAAVITSLSGDVLDVNVRAIDFFRYPAEEFCALNVLDVVSGADEALLNTLRENLENERFTLIQAFCERRNGELFPAEIAVNRLVASGEDHLCFFVRDITLRRQAEQMLRTEHNAIQNSGNGIAIANLEGTLEYVNPAIVNLWGRGDARDFVGTRIHELWPGEAGIDQMIAGIAAEGGQPWRGELATTDAHGSERHIQVLAACNRDSEGIPVGIVLSFVDISDRRRAETAQREAERHRVMLESLGAACHHLGQPATVLLANLGIMKQKSPEDNELLCDLVTNSLAAAETLAEVLHKLNAVNEYRTTAYLKSATPDDETENRILEI